MGARIAASIVRTGFTCEDLFRKLDVDFSGTLSRAELEQVIKRFEPTLSLTESAAIFRKLDANGSGGVDLVEFKRALVKANGRAIVTIEEKIKMLGSKFRTRGYNQAESPFCLFDQNRDGFLSMDEFKRCMRTIGAQELSDDDLQGVF